jgi:hypothetical protein
MGWCPVLEASQVLFGRLDANSSRLVDSSLVQGSGESGISEMPPLTLFHEQARTGAFDRAIAWHDTIAGWRVNCKELEMRLSRTCGWILATEGLHVGAPEALAMPYQVLYLGRLSDCYHYLVMNTCVHILYSTW